MRLWDMRTGEARVLPGHTDEIWKLHFSADSKRLASSSKDKTARVWDLETGASRVLSRHTAAVEEAVFSPRGKVASIAFSPDGAGLVSAGEDGVVWLGDIDSGESRAFEGHEDQPPNAEKRATPRRHTKRDNASAASA